MGQLIFFSLIGGLLSLIGGLLLVWRADLAKRFTLPLLSFAAGSFLGATFLDILPEAVELVEEPHPIFLAALAGFLAFFALERLFMRYLGQENHGHKHADHTESLPTLVVVGDSLHNFLDGITIAIAFLLDPSIGLVTTLAVAAHEIPQEIGDFSILLNQGWSKGKVVLVNIFQSLLTVLGAIIGYYLGQQIEPYLPYLLAVAAGIFLYISASDIIPEIHHQANHRHVYRVIFFLLIGVVLVGTLSALAHSS